MDVPAEVRKKRIERVSFGLNGLLFLVAAWDGYDTHAALWTVVANLIFGLLQLGALARTRNGDLPGRLPFFLAASGMFISALAVIHHKSGLPYAYGLAALLNFVFAILGPEGIRRLRDRQRLPSP